MIKRRGSIKIAKGVRINVGKRGVTSVSLGGKGLTLNGSKKGVKATATIPKTGLSASEYLVKSEPTQQKQSVSPQAKSESNTTLVWLVIIGLLLVAVFSKA